MTPDDRRKRARELAHEHIAKGDPTGWFDRLYQEYGEGKSTIVWLEGQPNANLVSFWKTRPLPTSGKNALIVGCGMGDDAEQLSKWGFATSAFDIAPTAVEGAKKRFPESRVDYRIADLLNPPQEWSGCFDFVFEAYTVQAMPPAWREAAIQGVAGFVKPGGNLLVVARGRDEADSPGDMPWPLTRAEVDRFQAHGLKEISFEDYIDDQGPREPARRFRVLYEKPA